MGLFGSILKNAVNEGISKGLESAVSKVTEKTLSPVAERFANATAAQLNTVADTIETNQTEINSSLSAAMKNLEEAASRCDEAAVATVPDAFCEKILSYFPRWTYTPITDYSNNREADYVSTNIHVPLNDDLIAAYQQQLKLNGFSGDFQIMRRIQGNVQYIVDFTFVSDNEIVYYLHK